MFQLIRNQIFGDSSDGTDAAQLNVQNLRHVIRLFTVLDDCPRECALRTVSDWRFWAVFAQIGSKAFVYNAVRVSSRKFVNSQLWMLDDAVQQLTKFVRNDWSLVHLAGHIVSALKPYASESLSFSVDHLSTVILIIILKILIG